MKPATLSIGLRAVASIGPGFADWASLQAVFSGQASYTNAATTIPPSTALPPTERRRVGLSVKIALACAEQLFASAEQSDTTTTASIFTSSGGDGDNCHQLCTALTETPVMLSPTKFTNSVHNAPAGYFGIAHHAVQASNSICARDGSFAAGLLEAAATVLSEQTTVALIAYDVPYPEPLNSKRTIAAPMGIALLLDRVDHPLCIARLDVGCLDAIARPSTAPSVAALQAVWSGIPAARGLPLLEAIHRVQTGASAQSVVLDAGEGDSLGLTVHPA